MSPNQPPTPPASDGTPRQDDDFATRPMWWMQATGFALFIAGVLIGGNSPYSTATWSWQTVGLLLGALGLLLFLAVPGLLVLLGHP